MKTKILTFFAGIVTALIVAVTYYFLQKRAADKAFEQVANHDLKENIDRTYEEFDREITRVQKEIGKESANEIRKQVHSFFGLDS